MGLISAFQDLREDFVIEAPHPGESVEKLNQPRGHRKNPEKPNNERKPVEPSVPVKPVKGDKPGDVPPVAPVVPGQDDIAAEIARMIAGSKAKV